MPTTADLNEPVYTYTEAAALLRIHRTTLARWVRERRITYQRRGRAVVFPESALRDAITVVPAKKTRRRAAS